MPPSPKINVAVVGVGLVGSEFINQLLSLPAHRSPFQLISLTSSTRAIFNASEPIASGIDWKSLLSASTEKPDFPALTERLSKIVNANQKVVLVDNTSSDDVAALYPTWLGKGINVVTPNKKAYSGDLALYESILSASEKSGARFLNESTVGAGLPVISTLKELVMTGDKVCVRRLRAYQYNNFFPLTHYQIVKIEGVFSGTMSYIFNEFSTGEAHGPKFSSVVSIAREKGYTVRYCIPCQ
jgi:homoserine dehydrogenase